MTELRRLLTGADPIADGPELPAEDAAAMKRRILSAARTPGARREPWAGFAPIAAAVIVTVAAGVALGLKLPERVVATGTAVVVPSASPAERRQVQFSTPGGTRIIWTLDPDFELRGTTP